MCHIFRVTGPLCGEFIGPRTEASYAELWCFLCSATWINDWVKNREAGELRRHRSHYDVIVIIFNHLSPNWWSIFLNITSKSLANRITSDQRVVIHGNKCLILFLTRYFMSWTHNSAKKGNHRLLISPVSLRTVFSDLALWRHHSWSVTSRELEVLALWQNIRGLFLHAQIGTNIIFTNE